MYRVVSSPAVSVVDSPRNAVADIIMPCQTQTIGDRKYCTGYIKVQIAAPTAPPPKITSKKRVAVLYGSVNAPHVMCFCAVLLSGVYNDEVDESLARLAQIKIKSKCREIQRRNSRVRHR
jgi:hypothetical protein